MAAGKLARATAQNKKLRVQNRELDLRLGKKDAQLSSMCEPATPVRKLANAVLSNGTAYAVGRAYVWGQTKGFMPTSVPVDLMLGVGLEGAMAFLPGVLSELAGEMGSGIANGALGRMAAFHQLPTTEVAGRKALLLPEAAPRPPNAPNPPGGGIPQGG